MCASEVADAARLMQRRWGCALNPSFWLVLAAKPPTPTKKKFVAAKSPRTPPPEVGVVTALVDERL
jgi:hypothetical protein